MDNNPVTLLAIAEALDEAGLPPEPPSVLDRMATALAMRFPAMLDAGGGPRASWARWTPEQEQQLRALYESDMPLPSICERLGRTRGAVLGAVSRLGLNRSDDNVTSARLKARHAADAEQ